jgi:hypothetical protein
LKITDAEHHCPFLNRADERCSDKMNLSALGYAYKFCFDNYKKCPVYMELLVDRRIKRLAAATVRPRYEDRQFIQLSISHRHAQRARAIVAGISGD